MSISRRFPLHWAFVFLGLSVVFLSQHAHGFGHAQTALQGRLRVVDNNVDNEEANHRLEKAGLEQAIDDKARKAKELQNDLADAEAQLSENLRQSKRTGGGDGGDGGGGGDGGDAGGDTVSKKSSKTSKSSVQKSSSSKSQQSSDKSAKNSSDNSDSNNEGNGSGDDREGIRKKFSSEISDLREEIAKLARIISLSGSDNKDKGDKSEDAGSSSGAATNAAGSPDLLKAIMAKLDALTFRVDGLDNSKKAGGASGDVSGSSTPGDSVGSAPSSGHSKAAEPETGLTMKHLGTGNLLNRSKAEGDKPNQMKINGGKSPVQQPSGMGGKGNAPPPGGGL